jgi:N-methylhydantoinase A
MRAIYERLEADGRTMLRREQVPDTDVAIEYGVEMQYVGQSYMLAIPLPGGTPSAHDMATAEQAFHDAHARAYGFSAPVEPTQIVNLRLAAVGRIPAWEPRRVPSSGPKPEPKQTRPVYFEEAGGFVEAPIYDRAALAHVTSVSGPAIVEEMDSTTVIHPGYRGDVDEWGNLVLRPREGEDPR